MSPRTAQSGTYYSFASDEPYARFLVYHSYLTCLYLPFKPENHPYEFPPELRISTYASHHIAFTSHHFALHCTVLQLHCLAIALSLPYTTPGDDPLPPDRALRAP